MPKRVDTAAQRRSIADAAIDVIDEVGLEGARLRDVARAARVTTGAVTHYFDGKDSVIEAALAEIVRRTLERMNAGRGSPPPDLATFIGRVCKYLPLDEECRREWRVWLAFWGRAIADERLRAIHRQHYSAFVDRLSAILPELCASPRPAQRHLRKTADAVIAALDGVGTRATLEPEHWPPRRQKDTLSGLLRPLLESFIAGKDQE